MTTVKRSSFFPLFAFGFAAAALLPALSQDSPTVTPEATDHALILTASAAKLEGDSVRRNPRSGALAWWKSQKDNAQWTVRDAKNGTYALVIDYATPEKLAGQEFVIRIGKRSLKTKATASGGWGKWKVSKVGEIEIEKPGFSLSFAPANQVKGEDLLDLRAIQLIPLNSPRLKNLRPATPEKKTNIATKNKSLEGNKPEPITAGSDGVFTLFGKSARLFGNPVTLIPSGDKNHPEAAIDGWKTPEHRAEWSLRGLKAGRYDLLVDWAMPRISGKLQRAKITLDGGSLFNGNIRTTEGIDKFASYVIGTVQLPAGDHTLSFGPAGEASPRWVRLRSLRLVPAAGEGEFRIPPLTVPDGFTIEPAAIPPLVSHPMMACLDDRGRMFIAESAGTNAKAPELLETRPHKILMLEDKDGDGVFDKSTVFADRLVLPNGAHWHDGALYVCSPPYIWKFEDTDDDGVADKETPVGGKFGFNGMSSAFHGPVLGPDGRLYYCGGQHGWTLGDTSPGLDLKKEKWISRAPGVFSMWPDGKDPENRAQGGMANPVEVTFSPEGEVFGTVAVYQNLNGRTDALLHWIQGSVYNLRRGPPVHPRTSKNLLPPMSRRGWVAPPGLCRYRSGGFASGFGKAYRNDIFMCEFNTHRVYRIIPQRKGASYTTTDEIFLESTSPYTHFTDVFEDADGSLLVVDTGGWFLYGCPTSAIERPEIKGGIYRIRKKDAGEIDDHRGTKLDWKNPKLDWLDDPRFAVRDRAKTELAKQGKDVVAGLGEILTNPKNSEQFRREAIWTLTRIDHKDAREIVSDVMVADSSPSVRLAAARSNSVWKYPGATDRLLKLLARKDEPQILREAATALGRIGAKEKTVSRLMATVKMNAGKDPFLDHSLIHALAKIDHWSDTIPFLSDDDANIRRAALIACAEMASGKLTAKQVAPHLASTDGDLRAEALRVATGRPEWGGTLREFLKTSLHSESASSEITETLVAFSGDTAVQELVAGEIGNNSHAEKIALAVMRQAQLKRVPKSWEEALKNSLFENPDTDTIETISALKFETLDLRLAKILSDESQSPAVRFAALKTVADRLPAPLADRHFDFAEKCFQPNQPTQRRIDAASVLSRAPLSENQRLACAERFVPLAGPLQIGPLLGVFEKQPADAKTLDALAAALEKSPGILSIPSARVETLFTGKPAAAKPILNRLRAAESQRENRLDELISKIASHSGDADRGKAAFTKGTCAICHKARGEGGIIGPELTTIGAIRSERDLLEAIAFPSATFAREYEPMIITLKDGTPKMGRIGVESEEAIELINAQGQAERIVASQIASREMASISMMPPGLEHLLNDAELADLIAFLKSLK